MGHPFFAARRSASISAFTFAAVGPIAQTVIRMRPALKTKRRSVAFLRRYILRESTRVQPTG
uniref:Uncharacterized protein n=1 Tax=Rhizobium leguminosarum TaxID=384 RepID=A0A179BY32_RHILE|nr:hypothetical protein A4U53_38525 [Rhizobium leguminosarum]